MSTLKSERFQRIRLSWLSNASHLRVAWYSTVDAARQYVQEKAADELGGVEGHGLEPVAAFDPVVLPLEGDARLVERDEPGVGDRDAVGVARRDRRARLSVRRRAAWRRRPTRSGAKARARRRRRARRQGGRDRRRRRGGQSCAGRRGLRERGDERGATARARAGRSRTCRRSSATRPATGRRQER